MRNARPILALFVMLASCGAAFSDDEPDCIDPQTQMEMTFCAGLDYQEADAELNDIWPEMVAAARSNDEYVADMVRDRGVPSTLEALRIAQRAWLAYRDSQCEYEAYEVFGGTAQPMVGSQCLARLTRQRVEMFRQELAGR